MTEQHRTRMLLKGTFSQVPPSFPQAGQEGSPLPPPLCCAPPVGEGGVNPLEEAADVCGGGRVAAPAAPRHAAAQRVHLDGLPRQQLRHKRLQACAAAVVGQAAAQLCSAQQRLPRQAQLALLGGEGAGAAMRRDWTPGHAALESRQRDPGDFKGCRSS